MVNKNKKQKVKKMITAEIETQDPPTQGPQYPECYLHVLECRSGQTWIWPIHPLAHLDLERLIKRWADQEFGGELKLDPPIMPKLEGDYYAKIMTDNRPPDSIVCWDGGGFYLKGVEL